MKINKKIFIISFFGIIFFIFLFNFISADTSNTIIPCGGDSNVIIGCLESADLASLSSLQGGGFEGYVPEKNITTPQKEIQKKDLTPYIIISSLILLWGIFLIWKRKKRKCKLKLLGYDDEDDDEKKNK